MGELIDYSTISAFVVNTIVISCLIIYWAMMLDFKDERAKAYPIALAATVPAYVLALLGHIFIAAPLMIAIDIAGLRLMRVEKWLKAWLMFVASLFLGVIVAFFCGPMLLWLSSGKGF